MHYPEVKRSKSFENCHRCTVTTTAAAPASEGEAVVRSSTNMAAAKIVAVDFIHLY